MNDITYHPITPKDCRPRLFKKFSRYQEVTRVWRMVDGQWILREENFVQQWDRRTLRREAKKLRQQIEDGCYAFGAWRGKRLIGRASLSPRLFGSQNQYAQLKDLHITAECRGQGVGRYLFAQCRDTAQVIGARKLYISSFPAEETLRFYAAMGCVDAEEPDPELRRKEPLDRHLELAL